MHILRGDPFCNIELAFENVMDKAQFENKEKAKKNKKKKGKKGKKKDKIDELFPEGWDKNERIRNVDK